MTLSSDWVDSSKRRLISEEYNQPFWKKNFCNFHIFFMIFTFGMNCASTLKKSSTFLKRYSNVAKNESEGEVNKFFFKKKKIDFSFFSPWCRSQNWKVLPKFAIVTVILGVIYIWIQNEEQIEYRRVSSEFLDQWWRNF